MWKFIFKNKKTGKYVRVIDVGNAFALKKLLAQKRYSKYKASDFQLIGACK